MKINSLRVLVDDRVGVGFEIYGLGVPSAATAHGKVTRRYARLVADPRHKNLELIHCESIIGWPYGEWSMARVSLSDMAPQATIVRPDSNPYSADPLVMTRTDERIAQGRIIESPSSSGTG